MGNVVKEYMRVQSYIFSSVILETENGCGLNQGRWKETGRYVGCLNTK